MTVRIAVIGYGHLGRHHARLLGQVAGADLVAVADSRPEACAEAREKLGVAAVEDYRELLGRVDAVSVAVPTQAHREVAGFFLDHDVDVLVEKPIAPTAAEGLELVEIARRRGRILQVGHIERFNPAFRALRDQGIEPRYVEAQRLAPFTFRSVDVGVVLDLMIHDLDLVLALFGHDVVDVQAFGGSVFTPSEDMASATLRFGSGAVAQLTASRVALKPLRRFRTFSRDAYASIDFSDQSGVLIRKNPGWDYGKLDVAGIDTTKIDDLWKFVFEGLLRVDRYQTPDGNPLRDELASFVEAVAERKEPVVSGEAGSAAVALAARILESIRSHPW
jgi:predicted dehydrogenase